MRDAREHLHYLALEAARGAEGSIAGAEAALDQSIRDHNSIELERELCSAYRGAALLSCVQGAFAELRLSAHHDPIPDPEELRALNGKRPRPQLRKPALVSLLDEFWVNGQRIGDLTPEELEPAAKARERDARFIRLLIAGVPPGARVREHKNADDAKVCYALASSPEAPEPEPPAPVRARHRRRRSPRERQHPPRQAKTGQTRRDHRRHSHKLTAASFLGRAMTQAALPYDQRRDASPYRIPTNATQYEGLSARIRPEKRAPPREDQSSLSSETSRQCPPPIVRESMTGFCNASNIC